MKSFLTRALAMTLCCAALHSSVFAQQISEEDHLIQVLQSGASLADKDAACIRLKRIGTSRSVPALAVLLRDEQLSHSARYALESMPSPAAEAALVAALNETTGVSRVGIVNSLGFRRTQQAVPALSRLLSGPDADVSIAAAGALGKIGNPEAQAALQKALKRSSGKLHQTVVDSLLERANSLLASGADAKARSIFEQLYSENGVEFVRLAAYRGLILSSGSAGLSRMTRAIVHGPGAEQAAALQLVREIQLPGASKELAGLLPKLTPEVQVALVGCLAQRGDPAALPALRALAADSPGEVRLALINAVGQLGNAQDVPLLAGFAASGNPLEQNAARRALSELRGDTVTDTLLSQLATAPPAVQAELARALGSRADASAVPKLLELAAQPADTVRNASLKALAQLIEPEQLTPLVDLVLNAPDETARRETVEALYTAYGRFESRQSAVPTASLIAGLNRASPEARAALLPLCSGLPFPEVRLALRASLADSSTQVRTAAVRALCDTTDPQMLDDLVDVAQSTRDESLRTLAFRGTVRLATQEDSSRVTRGRQVAVLKTLLNAQPTADQKRVLLAGLAEVPTNDALTMAEALLEDEAVRMEAARAAVKIALALPSREAQASVKVLQKALHASTDNTTHQAVATALSQIEASADYITDWQVSGPYRLVGKDYAALFDLPFAPEVGEGNKAVWKPLVVSTDSKRPWVMDLLKNLGGEQCVGYARTWVHSDQEQPARLELGADDGVKVWLNNTQVYALNTARPLQPGSDKVDLTLRPGWNLLLLKVTQNNQGWEFCARFVKPDGSHLEGLRWSTSKASESSAGP